MQLLPVAAHVVPLCPPASAQDHLDPQTGGRLDVRLDLRIADGALLAARAHALGLTGRDRVPPLERVPLIRGPHACQAARWGWSTSSSDRGQGHLFIAHMPIAEACILTAWEHAWKFQRGVIPVNGWHVNGRYVAAPDRYLAALWVQGDDDLCATILTQPTPPGAAPGGWFPVSLTAPAALRWIAGDVMADRACC